MTIDVKRCRLLNGNGIVGDRENIKIFVRQILGCECPEKVFEYIDLKSDVRLHNGVSIRNRINIGNTLLIYIFEPSGPDRVTDALSGLLLAGKNERDRMGFNRFRLVLAMEERDRLREDAEKTFLLFPGKDEKIHLHIVNRNAIYTLTSGG